MKKQIIGLTGYFASGKTSIANIFEKHNYLIIEVDELGHKALEQQKESVIKLFGKSILNNNKNINRKKLGAIVFKNKNKLQKLENILHPYMKKEIKNIIKKTAYNKILISAAILIEMKINTICNYNILVWTPINTIIQRAVKRNKITEKHIRNILKNQLSLKKRLRSVDYIIKNDESYDKLYTKTKELIYLLNKD